MMRFSAFALCAVLCVGVQAADRAATSDLPAGLAALSSAQVVTPDAAQAVRGQGGTDNMTLHAWGKVTHNEGAGIKIVFTGVQHGLNVSGVIHGGKVGKLWTGNNKVMGGSDGGTYKSLTVTGNGDLHSIWTNGAGSTKVGTRNADVDFTAAKGLQFVFEGKRHGKTIQGVINSATGAKLLTGPNDIHATGKGGKFSITTFQGKGNFSAIWK